MKTQRRPSSSATLLYELAQLVMRARGEAREPYADHAIRREFYTRVCALLVFLLNEVKRHEHAPVEVGVAFACGAGRKVTRIRSTAQGVDELFVVGNAAAVGAVAELREGSARACSA